MSRPRKFNYEEIYKDYKIYKEKQGYPTSIMDIAKKHNATPQTVINIAEIMEKQASEN